MSVASGAVETARNYYNSADADLFYARVWGGEDIHIGLYESDSEPIGEASRRTVERMIHRLEPLPSGTRILDLGSGYCGAARVLAETLGAEVVAVNLSEVENSRARELNRAHNLADRIRVVDGSFESIDAPDRSFDVAWSQDAILHSGDRSRVFSEVARLLKPGGQFVFTDPMRSDACDVEQLQPILDRIHLSDLGSPAYYRAQAKRVGIIELSFERLTHQLVAHYRRVLQETERRFSELASEISPEYLRKMKKGLQHWIDGGMRSQLAWGIFHFRKPEA